MAEPSRVSVPIRFGPFEVSPDSGELRKNGTLLKLSGQAIQVLVTLLERPGQLVTREELRQKLWPGASFGDFEHGINAVIKRLRDVLGDSATEPKFIETIPRHGYRFIQPVRGFADAETVLGAPPLQRLKARRVGLRYATVLAVALGLISGVPLWRHLSLVALKSRAVPMTPLPFTSFRGKELGPSFSPNGNQIALSWNGEKENNFDIYVKTIGAEKLLQLTFNPALDLQPAWSPDGRFIAFQRHTQGEDGIFLVPVLGGQERKLRSLQLGVFWYLESFDWSPDGKNLVFTDSLPAMMAGAFPSFPSKTPKITMA
jgi:DNA-binding winged helix-turn-helix (wHTH) protein